jgi:hypothetical protein
MHLKKGRLLQAAFFIPAIAVVVRVPTRHFFNVAG